MQLGGGKIHAQSVLGGERGRCSHETKSPRLTEKYGKKCEGMTAFRHVSGSKKLKRKVHFSWATADGESFLKGGRT